MRDVTKIILLIVVFSTLAAVVLATNADSDSCGVVVADLQLNASITIPANGTCFIINDSNITIQGNGSTILGNITGAAFNVSGRFTNNITIINLTIMNFTTGINASHSRGHNFTLLNFSAMASNYAMIQLYNVTNSSIARNTFVSSTTNQTGIWLDNSSSNNISLNNFNFSAVRGYSILLGYTAAFNNSFVGNTFNLSSSSYGVYANGTVDQAQFVENKFESTSTSPLIYFRYVTGTNTFLRDLFNSSNFFFEITNSSPSTSFTQVVIDSLVNLTINSIKDIQLLPVSSRPADPNHKVNYSAYINVTNTSAAGSLEFNVTSSPAQIARVSNLTNAIFRYNGSEWSKLALSSPGVNSINASSKDIVSGVINASTGWGFFGAFGNTPLANVTFISPELFDNVSAETLNVTAINASNVFYRYFNATENSSWFSMNNPSGNFWNATINTSGIADGSYTIRINATDGELYNLTEIRNVTFDSTKPAVHSLAVSVSSTEVTLTVNSTDALSSMRNCTYTGAGSGTFNFSSGLFSTTPDGLTPSTDYIVTVTCFDTAGNVETNLTNFTTNAAASSSSSSSSSGGGGNLGASGGVISSGNNYRKMFWTVLNKDDMVEFKPATSDIDITKLSVEVREKVWSAWMQVTKLDALGNDVDKFVGSTYQTLEITKAPGLKDNILKNSNIEFRVTKKWLTDNKLDKSQVALFRWSEGKWNELATTQGAEDSSFVAYTASAPGFSYFIIGSQPTTKAAPAAEKTDATDKKEDLPDTAKEGDAAKQAATEETSSTSTAVWWVVGIVVILAVVWWFVGRPKSASGKGRKR